MLSLALLALSFASPMRHSMVGAYGSINLLSSETLLALNPGATKAACDKCVGSQKVALVKEAISEKAAEDFQAATQSLLEAEEAVSTASEAASKAKIELESAKGAKNVAVITLNSKVSTYNLDIDALIVQLKSGKLPAMPTTSDVSKAATILEDAKAMIKELLAKNALIVPLSKNVEKITALIDTLETKLTTAVKALEKAKKKCAKAQATKDAASATFKAAKALATAAVSQAEADCSDLMNTLTGPNASPSPEAEPVAEASPSPEATVAAADETPMTTDDIAAYNEKAVEASTETDVPKKVVLSHHTSTHKGGVGKASSATHKKREREHAALPNDAVSKAAQIAAVAARAAEQKADEEAANAAKAALALEAKKEVLRKAEAKVKAIKGTAEMDAAAEADDA